MKTLPKEAERALGLREQKAAATKIALVRALEERLKSAALADISVDVLAADVGVSRMTFFNYFPTKEQALALLLFIWLYEARVSIAKSKLTGRAALRRLFEEIGERVHASPSRARQIFSALTNQPPALPKLGRADRGILCPELDCDGSPSLGEVLIQHIEEAQRAKELTGRSSTYDLAHMLGGLLLGSVFVGRSKTSQDWCHLYRHHLERTLGPTPVKTPPKKNLTTRKKTGAKK